MTNSDSIQVSYLTKKKGHKQYTKLNKSRLENIPQKWRHELRTKKLRLKTNSIAIETFTYRPSRSIFWDKVTFFKWFMIIIIDLADVSKLKNLDDEKTLTQ